MAKAIYSIIQSENGKISNKKQFKCFNDARQFFNDCKCAVIFACRKGDHESVFYKNLSEEAVCGLMGWEYNNNNQKCKVC